MTQTQLAKLGGISAGSYANIETGARLPSLPVALKLVEGLDLAPVEALALLRELANLPAHLTPPNLAGLPLEVDGQAVELLELLPGPGAVGWSALVRAAGRPEATARRVHIAGLSLLPLATVRAA